MSDFVTDIRGNAFDRQVLQQTKPVIVDFWAPWCAPCNAMAPAFESLAETYADQMVFTKCDVDCNTAVAERYGIKAIPTLMIFQGGEIVHSITGMASQSMLADAINDVLAGEATPAPFVVN
jgi:thioredoxin 1